MHYGFPVKERDTIAALDTNTFYHHPIYLDVDVRQKNFSIYTLNVVTTFKEDITNAPFYKAKNTQTSATLEIPKSVVDLETAVNADNTLNINNLNAILILFGLQIDVKSTLPVITPH